MRPARKVERITRKVMETQHTKNSVNFLLISESYTTKTFGVAEVKVSVLDTGQMGEKLVDQIISF